jgi:hypothetical protein
VRARSIYALEEIAKHGPAGVPLLAIAGGIAVGHVCGASSARAILFSTSHCSAAPNEAIGDAVALAS